MKKTKSYTRIWKVEKILYAINDMKLPFPMTFSQMAWFSITMLSMIFFGEMIPLIWLPKAIRYIGMPVFAAWFMSQKTFDGKKPYGFILSVIRYFFRPKVTFAGKEAKFIKAKYQDEITGVRSKIYVLEDQGNVS